MNSGKIADHEWAWHIPTKTTKKETKSTTTTKKTSSKRKSTQDNGNKKKKRRSKKQKISKIETAGQKLPFNGCVVDFFFRDKEHGVEDKTSALRREDLDFNMTIHDICEVALKRLRSDNNVKKSESSIYSLSEENLERFRKFHVIFKMITGSSEAKVIGEWKAKNASSLQRTMYSVWDQCVDAKKADKARKRDVKISLLLSYKKAIIPSYSVVRRVSAKKVTATQSKSEIRRREARRMSRTNSLERRRILTTNKRSGVKVDENKKEKSNGDQQNNKEKVNSSIEAENTKLRDIVRGILVLKFYEQHCVTHSYHLSVANIVYITNQ